jgi:hypothetical protein
MKYKSKVIGLEEDIFDVGGTSDPAMFSIMIKSIKNYVEKTYKGPDNIVKAIQQLKHPTVEYDDMPVKSNFDDINEEHDVDAYNMANFAWK